ncbi:hypothetical protein PI124_g19217 [Phytophthora idaei]|nr:hypothetical protein PI125_g20203 [Phytophthora idaei]KAG3134643.1 hypothetical protein PI126_g18603 [Phytophthora idaei]KAG3235753.1 hypothetical protein PI124_g19217 [Phytophthora idaei]
MRVGFVVLATVATLLSSVHAESTDSLSKQKFTITSPDSNNALDGVYIRKGSDKYVILHLNDDESTEDRPGVDNGSSLEDDSASDGQEERALPAPVSAGGLVKVKETLKKAKNDFLWHFFRVLVPERFRGI